MEEYCAQAVIHKTEPAKHEGYNLVKKAVTTDKLLKAKHHFWISLISNRFFKFTKQKDHSSDLEKLLRDVMSRYLKTDVMTSANSYLKLVKVDPESQENTVSSSQIDVGIVTKRELNKLKEQKTISQKQKLESEINCKAFLTRTTEKLLEKSPLKFPVVGTLGV